MMALLSRSPGPPSSLVLGELPDPVPGPGEIRIDVRAVGVNFPDLLIIQDLYQVKPPRPFAPGSELSGVVDLVGSGVTDLHIGDRVMASPVRGAMAQKAIALPQNCFMIPQGMSFEEAAALLMTYGTSQHALKDRARLLPGETLLVLGAGGGVGLAAVELGKSMGARVVAAASSEQKVSLAEAHGADVGLVYPPNSMDKAASRRLSNEFKTACGPEGAHVVFDPVGGAYTEAALRAAAWEGRYLVVGFPAGIPSIPLNLPLLKGCQLVGVFWGEYTRRHPSDHAINVADLISLFARGAIRPEITARYPLARGGEAIASLAARTARGKVVITL
jgi:NADPH2:quinone reductase